MPRDNYMSHAQLPNDPNVYWLKDTEARDNRDKVDATGKEVGSLTVEWKTDANTGLDFTEYSVNVDDETIVIDADDNNLRVDIDAKTIRYSDDSTGTENVHVQYDGMGEDPTTVSSNSIYYDDAKGLYVRIAKADDYDETTQVRTPNTGYPGVVYPDGETITIDAKGAISAMKLHNGDALALDDADDKYRLNVKVDSEFAGQDKSLLIGGDVTQDGKSYVKLNKDDKTIVYDATDELIKVNLDDETLIYDTADKKVELNKDDKTLKYDTTDKVVEVNLDEKTLIYDATNDNVRLAYDGFDKSETDAVTLLYDTTNKYVYARKSTDTTWTVQADNTYTLVKQGFDGVSHPDGKTIKTSLNGIYAVNAEQAVWDADQTTITKQGIPGIVKPDGKTTKIDANGYLVASSGDFHIKAASSIVPNEPGLYYISANLTFDDGSVHNGTWILEYYVTEDNSTYGYQQATMTTDPSVVARRVMKAGTWTTWRLGFANYYI